MRVSTAVALTLVLLLSSLGAASGRLNAGFGSSPLQPGTFNVVFTESGLASGTSWSVTLNGTSMSSTSSTITFAEPNGSYPFSVSASCYAATPPSGTVIVSNKSVNQSVSFTPSCSVKFTESGLPSGQTWGVTLNGVDRTTTTPSSITFSGLTDGTYPFTVDPFAGFQPAPPSGSITVSGSSRTQAISWSAVNFAVSFVETGLPSGTKWSVNLNGTNLQSTSTTITFSEPNGNYPYSIGPVSGYHADRYSGTVGVAGADVTVAVTWSQVTYAVTFTESGLPGGTYWSVNLSSIGKSNSNTPTITFPTVPNGSYPYVVTSSDPHYHASPSGGTVTVNGNSRTVSIAWTLVVYALDFTESGLPPGTQWGITLGSVRYNSTAPTISFKEPNGSYSFSVVHIPGYTASFYSGTAVVNGGPVTETIYWSQNTYAVQFSESGLPQQTNWSVTLSGITLSSTLAVITFQEPSGAYPFKVPDAFVPGLGKYYPAPSNGTVSVRNATTTQYIQFYPTPYLLSFTEKGLPPGTNWSVNLTGPGYPNGARQYSDNTTVVVFTKAVNGTYSYLVNPVRGYAIQNAQQTFKVTGVPINFNITFIPVFFPLTFSAGGLPPGTSWAVILTGVTHPVSAVSVSFLEPNGTYPFTVLNTTGGYYYPASVTVNGAADLSSPNGAAVVNGVGVIVNITFAQAPQAQVIFIETGLLLGLAWTVTLGNTTLLSTTGELVFSVPLGTYSYYLGPVAGYQVQTPAGMVRVTTPSTPVTVNVVFLGPNPHPHNCTGNWCSVWPYVAILGGVAAVLLVAVAVALRRTGKPPNPDRSPYLPPSNGNGGPPVPPGARGNGPRGAASTGNSRSSGPPFGPRS